MRFEDARLIEPILRAVRAVGYEVCTDIQAQAIPHVLKGRDVMGCAQTGTGKTAAFALPILQRLSEFTPKKGARRTRCLVLAPTRELALQIHESFVTYGQYLPLRYAAIFGGVNQNPQARALRAGVDVLIATPGRLLDLMQQGHADLANIEILVLDEADRMLDMGFLPDIRRILTQVPRRRQSLMFSATMPADIRRLANDILHQAVSVEAARVSSAATTVAHFLHHVEKRDKPALLAAILSQTAFSRALVFTRTKHGADKVVRQLMRTGMRAAALHGNKSQNARTRALGEFRSGKTPVLVATDIAARGLDVDDISHVINFDLTAEPETYVHRIGRTGRAGATGIAISFCSAEERANLRAIERLMQASLELVDNPSGFVATQAPPADRPAAPQVFSRTPGRADVGGTGRGRRRVRSRRPRGQRRSQALARS